MTLVRDVIARSRRHFMSAQRDRYNILTATIDNAVTTTTVTVTYDVTAIATRIDGGSIIEIDTEQMLVVSTPSTTSLTVIRAFNGTPIAAHTAGALVRVNPVLSDYDLFLAVNDELAELSVSGLFVADVVEFTATGNVGYDFGPRFKPVTGLLAVRYFQPRGAWTTLGDVSWDEQANTTDFPSGYGLMLKGGVPAGFKVRVWYAGRLQPVASILQDLESVSGAAPQWVDIVALGAALRVSDGREVGRDMYERQGDTRRAAEVPPGAQLQAPRLLQARYDRRISSERGNLFLRWGVPF